MTEQDQSNRLEAWLVGKPAVIGEVARRYPPWKWWTLRTDDENVQYGTRYFVYSYAEDGTVQIVRHDVASGRAMYRVFGINPSDLNEADSPDDARKLMTTDEIAIRTVWCEARMAALEARVATALAETADDEDDENDDDDEEWN